MKTIGILGAGNMGSAIFQSNEHKFHLYDTDKNKVMALGASVVFPDLISFLDRIDTVIIAIKPQSFFELNSLYLKDKLVISVMAGVSIEQIHKKTEATKIIRVMPNLAISKDQGVVGWHANNDIDDRNKEIFRVIFQPLGFEVEVKNENHLDAITAISGSGLAYFFHLTNLLEKKAKSWGLDEAEKIAVQTAYGASLLMNDFEKSPKEWVNAVRSNKGTTDAALKYMDENHFNEIFSDALEKAHHRSEELSAHS